MQTGVWTALSTAIACVKRNCPMLGSASGLHSIEYFDPWTAVQDADQNFPDCIIGRCVVTTPNGNSDYLILPLSIVQRYHNELGVAGDAPSSVDASTGVFEIQNVSPMSLPDSPTAGVLTTTAAVCAAFCAQA